MQKLVVLIVDDEPILRLDAVDSIEDAGHIALEAANAEEAIALLESRPDITVVFTDIDMPGTMDGIKLAHFVRDRWPPVTIVVASGRVVPKDGDLPSNVEFLSKPYTLQSMHRTLGLS